MAVAAVLIQEFPELDFTLNGGVLSYDDIETHLSQGVAGVMIGETTTTTTQRCWPPLMDGHYEDEEEEGEARPRL